MNATLPPASLKPVHAWDSAAGLAVLLATGLGACVRFVHVLNSDFPLNDGGLFYSFIHDLQEAGFWLPYYTSYNLDQIPFAYPPLSFYLTGLLCELFRWPVLEAIRVLPAAISTLTIPAVYLLSRALLPSRLQALLAVFSFALLPTAFDWLVVGGGLPRAFGFLCSILTLHQAYRLYTSQQKRFLLSTILFGSLTILFHPVDAWFTAYSSAILFAFFGRNKPGLLHSAAAAAGILVCTAPWWAVVTSRHGLVTLQSATQAGLSPWEALLVPFLFIHTNEPLLDLQAVFGLLGVFVCWRRKSFFWPAWLGLVFVLEPRLSATYTVLPMAMLVALGLDGVVLPGIACAVPLDSPGDQDPPVSQAATSRAAASFQGMALKLAVGYFLIYLVVSAYLGGPQEALSREQRAAMQWIGQNTPANSRFLVVSQIEGAGIDYISEWFPALAGRTSLATPQGYEWFPGRVFSRRWLSHGRLQSCAVQDAACLEDWARSAGTLFTHVYLAQKQSGPEFQGERLYTSLSRSPDYELIYAGPGGTVFVSRPTMEQ